MLSQAFLILLALPLLTVAHFILDYPSARGFDESLLSTGPCATFPQTQNRTKVNMNVFPVELTMGHDQTVIQMLLALGNEAGGNFNIVLEKTFAQVGLGSFCLPQVVVPSSLNITDGMNATLQVVTDGEGGGGLYNCADITFTSIAETVPSFCKNGTGVTASALPPAEANLNANESTATGGSQSGGSSGSGTSSAASSTPTSEAMMLTASWCVLGAALIGAATLL